MKILIASDHRGYELKEKVKKILKAKKIEFKDMGVKGKKSSDYPDTAIPLAERISMGEYERGILICNTGIGMSIAANKVKGAYAALCITPQMAEFARKHNNANVITISAAYTDQADLEKIVMLFLETEFEGGRHDRRFKKIVTKESKYVSKEEYERLTKKLKKWEKEAHHWQSRAWRR